VCMCAWCVQCRVLLLAAVYSLLDLHIVAAGAALSHPCHIYVHVKEARQPTGACVAPPAVPTSSAVNLSALLHACMRAAWARENGLLPPAVGTG
jgi:hypothetical protein